MSNETEVTFEFLNPQKNILPPPQKYINMFGGGGKYIYTAIFLQEMTFNVDGISLLEKGETPDEALAKDLGELSYCFFFVFAVVAVVRVVVVVVVAMAVKAVAVFLLFVLLLFLWLMFLLSTLLLLLLLLLLLCYCYFFI